MIISASRRTDIPAFYSDWFMNRVREGFFYRINPFNSNQVSGFSLRPEHVDAICFWTKDPRPLMPRLAELDERGINYYFQFTLNAYDRTFEPNVPTLEERIECFRELAGRIGPERVVWRYDPVVLSNFMTAGWHLLQFDYIASKLKGFTRRVMISFCDFDYKWQSRNNEVLQKRGVKLSDIAAPEHRNALEKIARWFKEIARHNAMEIFSCGEETDLTEFGIDHGACIDGRLIKKLFGGNPSEKKDTSQRKACGCVESVDMGAYNTCRFRCVYCYANYNEGMIEENCLKHYKDGPALIGRYEGPVEIKTSLTRKKESTDTCIQNLGSNECQ